MFSNPSRKIRLLACLAILASGEVAIATPYVPKLDSEVLEHLPTRPFGPSPAQERSLRELVARQPDSLDLALRLAQIEVERSRATSDPRPLGQAQALLAPWWDEARPPVPVLLLRATIRQRSHVFAPARDDLRQAVDREPDNAQAWLILASIDQVTGRFDAAAESCSRLREISTPLVVLSCTTALDGVRGRAAQAYAALADVMKGQNKRDQKELRSWMLTLQAELAERLDRRAEAERLYQESLSTDPNDTYTIAAFSDFLLDADRPEAVVALIASDTPIDTLLLRRAQAAQRLHSDHAGSIIAELDARFAASRERGDRVHLREEARYRLELANDPVGALELAQANWQVQKEPLDARILLECAIAAGKPEAASEVIEWVHSTHLESPALARLVAQVSAA